MSIRHLDRSRQKMGKSLQPIVPMRSIYDLVFVFNLHSIQEQCFKFGAQASCRMLSKNILKNVESRQFPRGSIKKRAPLLPGSRRGKRPDSILELLDLASPLLTELRKRYLKRR